MVNKYIKKYSVELVIREMQIKTAVNAISHPQKMAKIGKTNNTKY